MKLDLNMTNELEKSRQERNAPVKKTQKKTRLKGDAPDNTSGRNRRTTVYTFRLPNDISEKIEEEADKRGIRRNDIAKDAVIEKFSINQEIPNG